jgi:hypothetical protein
MFQKSWYGLLVSRDVVAMRERAPQRFALDNPDGVHGFVDRRSWRRCNQVCGESLRGREGEPVAANQLAFLIFSDDVVVRRGGRVPPVSARLTRHQMRVLGPGYVQRPRSAVRARRSAAWWASVSAVSSASGSANKKLPEPGEPPEPSLFIFVGTGAP